MKSRTTSLLMLLLIIGSVMGSFIWGCLEGILPEVLTRSFTLGMTDPLYLDLNFLSLTLGFALKLNIGSMIGMITALVFWWRR